MLIAAGKTMRLFSVLAFTLACAAGLSSETRVVSRTSQGKTTIVATEIREIAEGKDLRVEERGEEGSTSTLLAEDGTVKSTEFRAKDGTIRMVSDGKAVAISGTWKDKPVSGQYDLKGQAFYGEGFKFATRAFARGGCVPLEFPMISPTKPSKALVLKLTKEGSAAFKGREATEVKVAPSGALALFWSARLLIDDKGYILRYEGNQGPGTADMVTELVEVRE
jgi:hypothetical protein